MHFAKRMRARKEAMPEIDLPLAFKNGLDALRCEPSPVQVGCSYNRVIACAGRMFL